MLGTGIITPSLIVIILRFGNDREVQQRSSLSDVPLNTPQGAHRIVELRAQRAAIAARYY